MNSLTERLPVHRPDVWAFEEEETSQSICVIDYSLPDTQWRLWRTAAFDLWDY